MMMMIPYKNPQKENSSITIQKEKLERGLKWDLREEIGDVEALSDESEEALQGLRFLRVESAFKERTDADVIGVVVEVGVGADPENHR